MGVPPTKQPLGLREGTSRTGLRNWFGEHSSRDKGNVEKAIAVKTDDNLRSWRVVAKLGHASTWIS
jgi:hypothetical protein